MLIQNLASGVVNLGSGSVASKGEHMAIIEVVVLRSIELQRPKAPNPSVSELHPNVFHKNDSPRSSSSESAVSSGPNRDADMSDLGGLFDGASDIKESQVVTLPFGGDMAWDAFEQPNRGPHFNTDWSRDPQQPNANNNYTANRSHPPSRSSSTPAAGPAVQIFVNQPPASVPDPWPAAEPPQWRRPPGSIADSWSLPAYGSQKGQDQGVQADNSWEAGAVSAGHQPSKPPRSDRIRHKASNYRNSPQQSSSSSSGGSKGIAKDKDGWGDNKDNGWGKSKARSKNYQPQNVPGTWNTSVEAKQTRSGSHGLNGQGRASTDWDTPQSNIQENNGWNADTPQNPGGHNNDSGWGNNETSNNQHDTGWDNGNNTDNDQGNWDSNGQNSAPNDDWEGDNGGGDDYNNYEDGKGWDSGQTNLDENGARNEGGWNADRINGPGQRGWNDTGQDNYNSYGGNHHKSGNSWNNADAGAQERQASSGQNWDTSAPNQDSWNQSGGANDAIPVTTGGHDPAKIKSRRASSGQAKSPKSKLSRQATMNSIAHTTGWMPPKSVGGNGAVSAQAGKQQSEVPSAWPEKPQHLAGFGAMQNGQTASSKSYHVIPDAAGNPRLPVLTPAPPIVEAPAPGSPPVKSADMSHHIQRGSPALYQHKTASPRYIDTHDKPYASFIFKYRPKAVIEQMLNLTIPDTDAIEKAKLAHLSKEELIEQVIKTKSRLNSTLSSAGSSLGSVPPSFNNFANGGNGGWGAYGNGDNANQSHKNDGWNTSNGGNGNAPPGGSGGAFGTALNDKLAALVGTNKNSNSSSHDGQNKQGWNNAPPGSPLANNGNASFGGPSKGHAPYPPAMREQNNSNWNGQPAAGSNQGGGKGGRIDTWLSKTPMGASVSGHKPWNGVASVKSGGDSNFGGNMGNNNNSRGNGGRSQTNNNGNGGWNGDWGGTQKGGAKSRNGGWNDNNGNGGWNEGGGNGQHWNGDNQTRDWDSGNGNGGGGWNNGGNANGKGGYQTDNWNDGNGNGNDGGDWNGISNGNQQAGPNSGW
ncbi:MAG: hypothetical protein Q9171_003310 [Xanthocarpia ochracea]